jgi:SAM-dependent methyltransferase
MKLYLSDTVYNMLDIVDFKTPESHIHTLQAADVWKSIPVWDAYMMSRAQEILKSGGFVVDIGGGMRLDKTKSDGQDEKRVQALSSLLQNPALTFHITDYTNTYHPDSVQDIHALTFETASVDGLFCLAVLEHVYDPKKACEEIVRVLKKGAPALIYVPWMYRYHANMTEDYRDYYRYSKDGLAYLFRDCQSVELCPVRGLFESLLRFTPLTNVPLLQKICRIIDWSSKKMRVISSRQTSGYFVWITR